MRRQNELLVLDIINGLEAGGDTLYAKWKERREKTRGQEHRKAEEGHDKMVKRILSCLKLKDEIFNNLFQVISYQRISLL